MSEGQGHGGGPPRLQRVGQQPARAQPARPEVTAAAALAAGLPGQGSLESDGPLRLVYLAAAGQATGRLELETERGTYALQLRRGVMEHAASGAPEDDVGAFLVARGAVTAEAARDAAGVRGDHGGDLVAALAGLRLLNPAESFRLLQEHASAVVTRALAAERGSWRWIPDAPAPASAFPLGTRWGVLCDAARRLDGLAVRKLLGDRAHRVAARVGGRVELGELKLTALEMRAAGSFDGRSSPGQLSAARPAEAETLLRVALLLAETELLAFGEVASAAAKPTATSASRPTSTSTATATPTATPTPTPPSTAKPTAKPTASAKPPPPPAPAPPDAAGLQAFHDRVRSADHFEALGVKRDATTAQIKAAYFQLARTYHPDAGPPGEPPELKKLRADAFARMGEAWGVLGDEAKRAQYLGQLLSGGAGEVDVSAIFKAEETFQRATVYVRTRQYDKALEALAEAARLNPEEPEFAIWTAWVQFLVAPDRRKQHGASAAAIESALRKVPRCMPAYLFLGQMAKIAGDLSLAERHLKRGLALEPDHPELARELKYLRR